MKKKKRRRRLRKSIRIALEILLAFVLAVGFIFMVLLASVQEMDKLNAMLQEQIQEVK